MQNFSSPIKFKKQKFTSNYNHNISLPSMFYLDFCKSELFFMVLLGRTLKTKIMFSIIIFYSFMDLESFLRMYLKTKRKAVSYEYRSRDINDGGLEIGVRNAYRRLLCL